MISAVEGAVRAERRGQATVVRSGREALAHLTAPGDALPHLLCDPKVMTADWPQVLDNLVDPSGTTSLVMVSANDGLKALPPDQERVASALRAAPVALAALPPEPVTALRDGMARGEINVRYQPIVRIHDRKSVIGVSVNLSLPLLLSSDLLSAVERVVRRTGLHPSKLLFELTESEEVENRSALRRTLVRLRTAGHPVLLDDLAQRDARRTLLDLPFSGFKLDRCFVEAMPDDAAARNEARSLMRHAEAHGQVVVAEGVSDERVWRAVQGLGIHLAQGFSVGRPLPAAALPVWSQAWRGSGPARGVHRRYAKALR